MSDSVKKKLPYLHPDRCPTTFERKAKGSRIVLRRWQCPRPKMKGLPYCSYCEWYSVKLERLAKKKAAK